MEKEKILICVDVQKIPFHFVTQENLSKAIIILIKSKAKMCLGTVQFGLCAIINELILLLPFTSDIVLLERKVNELISNLWNGDAVDLKKKNCFRFESVYDCIQENNLIQDDGPFRVLFVYTRCYKPNPIQDRKKIQQLQKLMMQENVFFDVFLIGSDSIARMNKVRNQELETRINKLKSLDHSEEKIDLLVPDLFSVVIEWFRAVIDSQLTHSYVLHAENEKELYTKMMMFCANGRDRPTDAEKLVQEI